MPASVDVIEVAGARPRPPFGRRDWIVCAAATAGYGAFLWIWSRRALRVGAASCAIAAGHFHAAVIPWWVVLFALPLLPLVGGAVQWFRREPQPGHLTAWIFLALGLVSGIPVALVVPWFVMPAGYCVAPGAGTIRKVTLRGDGADLRFADLRDVVRMQDNHGSSWLRLRVRESEDELVVRPDDVADPTALRDEIDEQTSKAGLSRSTPSSPF